jgi:hypothetical protein
LLASFCSTTVRLQRDSWIEWESLSEWFWESLGFMAYLGSSEGHAQREMKHGLMEVASWRRAILSSYHWAIRADHFTSLDLRAPPSAQQSGA